ncbi:MAG: histidine ammonia-lyase [Ignavibacteriales bacterium]|nr:histidine ammonia-lyase [Ignavibacteriales bacterium]
MKTYFLDGNSLSIHAVQDVVSHFAPVKLSPAARKQITAARNLVESWMKSGETIYGVTTGFGEFSNVRISHENIEQLQENLILSHAAGAGEPLPREIVRAMMLLRINALAKGFSGIRLETVELLVGMLNKDIIPVIPSQGSVGSSGDLVQLAHLVLAMIGKGTVWETRGKKKNDNGHIVDSRVALRNHNLKPIKLTAKEGLALINGTQMMTAYAVLAVHQAIALSKLADIAAAMSVEALRGSDTQFDERIHKLRPYQGQLTAAKNLRRLMKGSEIRESHRFNDPRVQDAYSIRCIPQVHGASRDAIEYVRSVVSVEINSANDNPLIFPKDRVHLEGGNFHGQPIALAMDFLAIALAELANISERRIERLVNGSLSGLPRFLTANGGLNSGLMIAQYTAASIVSENKVLCHPGSVDSIPTSANQEDHNSMGSISAQKAWRVLKNVQTVLAIELLCAAQGLDFTKKLNGEKAMKAGAGVEAAYLCVRHHIKHLDRDKVLHTEIQKALALVLHSSLLESVETMTGKLG